MDPTKPPVKFNFRVRVVKKLQLRKIQVSGGRCEEVGSHAVSGEASKELHSDSLQVRTGIAKCRMLAPSACVLLRRCRRGRRKELGDTVTSVLNVANCTPLWRWNES